MKSAICSEHNHSIKDDAKKRRVLWKRSPNDMKLEIVNLVPATPSEFIRFWSSLYKDKLEHFYEKNIGKPLTEERVWDLYSWKNGTKNISANKRESIRSSYISELANLPSLESLDDGLCYIRKLKGGSIWGIFWLHCVNPELFPIFDQHTYRSMAKIDRLRPDEIPSSRPQVLEAYFNTYLPFTQRFSGVSQRDLDKALFCYGRFLKNQRGQNQRDQRGQADLFTLCVLTVVFLSVIWAYA